MSATNTTPTTKARSTRRQLLAALAVAALLALLAASPGMAASDGQQGAQLLGRVEAGELSCSALSSDQSERIGEYVMGRMLGSSAAHEAMDRQMTATMGSGGERQAHVYMGQRFSGCASGRAPAAFGAMMGMMGAGMMGSAYGGGSSYGMMGPGFRRGGATMGFGYVATSRSEGGWSSGDTVMVALMGVLIALALGGLAVWRPWRRPAAGTPLETLQARYARGEIDQQELERRRKALGGTP